MFGNTMMSLVEQELFTFPTALILVRLQFSVKCHIQTVLIEEPIFQIL